MVTIAGTVSSAGTLEVRPKTRFWENAAGIVTWAGTGAEPSVTASGATTLRLAVSTSNSGLLPVCSELSVALTYALLADWLIVTLPDQTPLLNGPTTVG